MQQRRRRPPTARRSPRHGPRHHVLSPRRSRRRQSRRPPPPPHADVASLGSSLLLALLARSAFGSKARVRACLARRRRSPSRRSRTACSTVARAGVGAERRRPPAMSARLGLVRRARRVVPRHPRHRRRHRQRTPARHPRACVHRLGGLCPSRPLPRPRPQPNGAERQTGCRSGFRGPHRDGSHPPSLCPAPRAVRHGSAGPTRAPRES